MADEDLMALVAMRRSDAFEVVYDRHSGPAFSLAHRIVGAQSLAEDVIQESFLSLWRSGGRYEGARGSLRTWILGIVHNRAIDALRRSAIHDRRRTGEEGIAERLEAPDRTDLEAIRGDQAGDVRRALAGLPDDQLRVLELAYFGGLSQSEVAEALGLPLGTVKSRMRLGLEKLRDELAWMRELTS